MRDVGGWRCATPELAVSLVAVGRSTVEAFGGIGTSIAFGRDGNPVLSYRSFADDAIKMVACADPVCATASAAVISPTGVGADSAVVVGANGNPVVAYHDAAASDLNVYACADAECTTGTVRALTDISLVGGFGGEPAVAIGVDGTPIVAYHHSGDDELRLYACADAECTSGSARVVAPTSDSIPPNASVAVNAAGDVVLGYIGDTDLVLTVDVASFERRVDGITLD